MATHSPVLLPGKSHGQTILVGHSPWIRKESDTTERLLFSDGKESVCIAGDLGLILGSGRSPGEGNGYLLQHFCLDNSLTEEPGRLQSTGSQGIRHN